MAEQKKGTRLIAGREYLSPIEAARYLGCCRSTFDSMVARSKHGTLRPSLTWYRDSPRGAMWFDKEKLAEWALKRGEMHV